MQKVLYRPPTTRYLKMPAVLVALAFFFAAFVAIAADNAAVYPGKLGITKERNLSPQEREVEARFAAYLEAHTDEAIARYIERYGKEVNTDNVRELSIDYAPGGPDADDAATKVARAKWSSAVQAPSSALSREIYRRALAKTPAPAQRKQVIFTAGGAGVGKTTSIQQIPGLARAVEAAEIIYDTTLSNLKSSMERVAQALAAGRTVSIVFVYRDPIDSFVGGVLPRAEKMGRTLPLEAFLATHIGAAEVLPKIAAAYRNDDRVAIAVIDNSRGRGNAGASDIEFVKAAAAKYSREELKAKLSEALDQAYEKGKRGDKAGISEAVYRGIKGHAP
jgi:Zeta toxin